MKNDILRYHKLNFDWGMTESLYMPITRDEMIVFVLEGERIINIYEDAKYHPNESSII